MGESEYVQIRYPGRSEIIPEDEMAVKHQICEGTVDNARATSETIAAVNTLCCCVVSSAPNKNGNVVFAHSL